MHEKEMRALNLNLALGVGRGTMRERKVQYDKSTQHPDPKVNEYHDRVASIANDDALFRKLQQDMRNSQHSILGSQHAIHMIVQECAKEAKPQAVETELVNLRAPPGGGEEEMTAEGGNSTLDGRQFFADLKAKSLFDRQPQIEVFRSSFKRGRTLRQKLHMAPCA